MNHNIKSLKFLSVVLGIAVAFSSCENKLDITPKGKTILKKTSELELLLNTPNELGEVNMLNIVDNECYSEENVNNQISKKNSLGYALLTFDESVDRAGLTANDDIYEGAYSNINYANTVIEKVDDSEGGSDALKAQLRAEARIIRAYMHYIVVNIYAAQYDESTASTTGGVPYCDNCRVDEVKKKLTVKEVYDRILEDCDESVIELLPDESTTIRGSKAWGYCVRAKVLFQMKRYAEALPLALKALSYNDSMADRRDIVETGEWAVEEIEPFNIFYIPIGMGYPWGEMLTTEMLSQFEPGDIVMEYAEDWGDPVWDTSYGERRSGVKGCKACGSFSLEWNNWGVTVERLMYVAAECQIRTGKINDAMETINKVRRMRIAPDVYEDKSASTEEEAMAILMPCKRVENIATYENFFDDKRRNTEPSYRKTIVRDMVLTTGENLRFELSPDSKLWIFPFPLSATRHNKTLTQNYDE